MSPAEQAEILAIFQAHNCHGCHFADSPKIGTGGACCTYPYKLLLSPEGSCLQWKPVAAGKGENG